MYAVWIKLDETLPWIELKGDYQTKIEARKAAKEHLKSAKTKFVEIPEKKRELKTLATVRVAC